MSAASPPSQDNPPATKATPPASASGDSPPEAPVKAPSESAAASVFDFLDGEEARLAVEQARQGPTLAHFRAQLEDLQDTSLTLDLNLRTFGTHPWVRLGRMGDIVSLS
jgi:hypothetical protein